MIRKVFVTVSAEGGVSPDSPQYAGVQGEHNLCRVSFDITGWAEEPFVYRGEFVDGNGEGGSTDLLEPVTEGGKRIVSFLLPEEWTAAGGDAVARLVASTFADGEESERAYAADVPIYFKPKEEYVGKAQKNEYAGMTALLEDVHNAIDGAGAAAAGANSAAGYANAQGLYANGRGIYAQGQGDYAKEQGDAAKTAAADLRAAAERGDFDGATGSQGPTGPQGPQGVGLLEVNSVVPSWNGANGYIYNVYTDYDENTAPNQVVFAAFIAHGLGEHDRVSLWGTDGVVIGTKEGDLEAEAGEHLFIFDAASTISIVKGDPGQDGQDAVVDPTLSAEGEAADAKAVGDALAAKADATGSYDAMTVGNAKQLLATVYTTDKTPYLFRAAGGSVDIGNRERDALVGGTVVWNQLINEDTSQYQYTKNTINLQYNVPLKLGHKYYVHEENRLVAGASSYTYTSVGFWNSDITKYVRVDSRRNNNEFSGVITFTTLPSGTTEDDFTKFVFQYISSGSAVDNAAQYRRLQLIDLTQMFGSTIADYIYSLEGSNRGSGVAWFKKLFAKDYYPHNPGELMSVSASAHKTVGFNAYDHGTGKAAVIGGNEYQITGVYTALSIDGETVTPDADGKFTPVRDGELTVTGGNFTDTCVHLVWSGYRDGEYAPYEAHTYPLDSDVVLRGIPKLDVSNNLYYDGDTYASDGTVTRKYGVVDLGTLNWAFNSGQNRFDGGKISDTKSWPGTAVANIKCAVLTPDSFAEFSGKDFVIAFDGQYLRAKNSDYTDAAAFKAAMSGAMLVYELETPTTETAEPFADTQIVDDFGTEEYVDSRIVPIPVGHVTEYPKNLRDKLQHLPDMASGDGDYIVRQTGQSMELVKSPALPAVCAADGAYVLKATVSGGIATYSWEVQS